MSAFLTEPSSGFDVFADVIIREILIEEFWFFYMKKTGSLNAKELARLSESVLLCTEDIEKFWE